MIANHDFEDKSWFATWLLSQINQRGETKTQVAKNCRMTPRTVYGHCKGAPPTFHNLIIYCWYFDHPKEYVYELWSKVKIEFSIYEDGDKI